MNDRTLAIFLLTLTLGIVTLTTALMLTTRAQGEGAPVARPSAPDSTPMPRATPRPIPSAASRTRPLNVPTRRPVAPVGYRPFKSGTAGSGLNWAALRDCESSDNYNDRDSPTYRGAYQFDRTTWQSVGGTGDPADAPPAEQDQRAHALYAARGRIPWPVCGRRL